MKDSKILFGFLSAVLLVLVVLGVFVVGVYKFDWTGPLSRSFVRIIPLPVGIVGGKLITFADYWTLLDAHTYLGSGAAEGDILQNLIQGRITVELLKDVSASEPAFGFDDYYAYLVHSFGLGPDDSASKIFESFGMSESDFQRLVVAKDYDQALLKIWWHSRNTDSEPSKKILRVQKHLVSGADFASLASMHSEDEDSKYIGGDLGFVSAPELPPWFAADISMLKASSTSGILVSPDGYHILEVVSKAPDGEESRLHLRQIFVRGQGFEEFFNKEKTRFRVLVFRKI